MTVEYYETAGLSPEDVVNFVNKAIRDAYRAGLERGAVICDAESAAYRDLRDRCNSDKEKQEYNFRHLTCLRLRSLIRNELEKP